MDADFDHSAINEVADAIKRQAPPPEGSLLCFGVSYGAAFAEYRLDADQFFGFGIQQQLRLTPLAADLILQSGPPCVDGVWHVYPDSWLWRTQQQAIWIVPPGSMQAPALEMATV